MSTSYIPLKDILVRDLLDGRLERFNIREQPSKDTTETHRRLTDGDNYVWVNVDGCGCVCEFVRYGGNSAEKFLNTVSDLFQTEIVSEHEPQYWGFDTEEEWAAYEQSIAKQEEDRFNDEFYVEILKFLREGTHDYLPGSGRMIKLEIAKALVQKHPSLRLPRYKDVLLEKIESGTSQFYQTYPGINVTALQDISSVVIKMIAADEIVSTQHGDVLGDVFQLETEQRYGGFDTEEEWIESMEKANEEAEDDDLQLLKYCRGEANFIRPGTGTMVEAKIAKILVDHDPSLLWPSNKNRLLNAVFLIYATIASKVSYNRLVFMTMDHKGYSTELADTTRNAISECMSILQANQCG